MAIWIALILAGALFLGQQKFFEKMWLRGLRVTLRFGEQGIEVGEPCKLREVIRNEKRMPLPALQVKFATTTNFHFEDDGGVMTTDKVYRADVFSVAGRKQVTRTLTFHGKMRGYYQISDIQLVAQDYFFSKRFAKAMSNQAAIYVYPAKLSLLPFEETYRQIMGELIARRSFHEDPFYFRGIRPYQPYDSMKHINWKSSAKHGELLVNSFEHTYSREVCILLNVNCHAVFKKKEVQEFSISIASTLSERFLWDGIPVAIYTNGKDALSDNRIEAPRGAGKAYRITIDRQLARIDLEQTAENFREIMERQCESGRTNVQYIVISSEHNDELLDSFARLRSSLSGMCMIVPETREEKWQLQDGMVGWEVETLG
ncbi:MAG: DUF58 domain-containing protein [Lachnospiraceae bacterium]|nr:DUF58 domain-containing protein [Lachnospiraceae bacterium]